MNSRVKSEWRLRTRTLELGRRTLVMGVVNLTPDSFSDGGRYFDLNNPETAIAHCLRLLDGQIAARLKELADDGLAENTIVFYYADNGGVLPRSKRFLEQSGVHVPLIVYFPPKWRRVAPAAPASRIAEPVSFVDFAPTVLSLAGVKIPGYMQGRAFAGPARAARCSP